jgi:hypothetical protein
VTEQESPDYDKVAFHAPVIAFSRTRVVAGKVPRAFGSEDAAGWRS